MYTLDHTKITKNVVQDWINVLIAQVSAHSALHCFQFPFTTATTEVQRAHSPNVSSAAGSTVCLFLGPFWQNKSLHVFGGVSLCTKHCPLCKQALARLTAKVQKFHEFSHEKHYRRQLTDLFRYCEKVLHQFYLLTTMVYTVNHGSYRPPLCFATKNLALLVAHPRWKWVSNFTT